MHNFVHIEETNAIIQGLHLHLIKHITLTHQIHIFWGEEICLTK